MLYFIYGDNPLELKYEDLKKEIIKKDPGIMPRYFDVSQKEDEDFLQAISINSMFGGSELLVLKRFELYKKPENFIKIMENYNIVNKDVIILYEEELNAFGKAENPVSKKLLDRISKDFKVIEAKQGKDGKSLVFYVSGELEIKENDAEKLLQMIGRDSMQVRHEVEKIKLFLNGEKFSFEKIKGIVTLSREYYMKNLVDELLAGNKENLLYHLKHEKDYMSFIYIFSNELDILLKLKMLQKKGVISHNTSYNLFKDRVYEGVKKYFLKGDGRGSTHAYQLFLKFNILNSYSEKFLMEKLNDILEIEYKFKSGQGDEEIMVESFIAAFKSE
ncbi:DNA polymerase III subunit delta [Ilyobacter sp.]|uniref:DNA polymerase III subunit delta n=1 Tax=Ilyobacter sp. TaxID=3100343 RepID=UPI003565618B